MSPGLLLTGAALLTVAAGCGGPEAGGGGVPDSVYVEIMARMVLLDSEISPTLDRPLSGASLDSARSRVLERHGVDAAELLEFARTRGGDPEQMQAIWQRVHGLSEELKDAQWRPLPDSVEDLAGDTLPDAAAGPPPDTAAGSTDTTRESGSGEGER